MATIYDFNTPFGMLNLQPNNSQPNIGPITPMTPKTSQPAKDRTGLATMLIALGGALQGDKDFVQKAIQLREMKESKKKQKELDKAWKSWQDTNLDSIPESLRSLVGMMDAEQGINLAVKTLEPPKTKTQSEYAADILNKIRTIPGYQLTPEDELVLQVLRKADPQTRTIEDLSAEALRLQGLGQTQPGAGAIKTITTQAEYDALADGEEYITNGIRYKKGE